MSTFFVSEYLGRQRFYRQNKLPLELNALIENYVVASLGERDQWIYDLYTNPHKDEDEIMVKAHKELSQLAAEKANYLAKQASNWESYLAAKALPEKPLPSLPVITKQTSKLKTYFQQVVRPKEHLAKPTNSSFLRNLFSIGLFMKK